MGPGRDKPFQKLLIFSWKVQTVAKHQTDKGAVNVGSTIVTNDKVRQRLLALESTGGAMVAFCGTISPSDDMCIGESETVVEGFCEVAS